MAILYYDEKKLFQLNTENTTYVICTESRICIRSAWMSRRSPRPSIRERNLRSSTVFQWNTRPEESAITVRAV